MQDSRPESHESAGGDATSDAIAAGKADTAGGGFARLCAVVLLPFAAGYFLSYLFRAVNAVVAPDIVGEFQLGATALGVLTAAYLLAFSAFQPVLGVLLDRFGPRRVQAALVGTAAAGALLFALARDAATLTVARALIGLGFSGGLMASFKAIVLWFPERRVPLANSLVVAFGALGVVAATRPADLLSEAVGWRQMFMGLALVTAAVAWSILSVVPERPADHVTHPLGRQIREVLHIYRDRVFWRLAPLVCSTAGGYIAVQTLWVGNWLRDVAGLSRGAAAELMMAMALAFSVGMLAQGIIADRLIKRGIGVMATVIGSLVPFFLCELGIVLGWTGAIWPLWVIFGMTGSVAVLAFPVLSQHFGRALAGRSHTSLNLLIFASAFAFQAAIGAVLELWPMSDGRYAAEGYGVALATLLAIQVASLAWYWYGGRSATR
ncbi:MAG: MFS transporter [Alphaproteobacteria bacterium]|nr:MFS transporter [Alphaproteobacteria bacterium]